MLILAALGAAGVLTAACGREVNQPKPVSGNETLWNVGWEMADDEQREAMADGEVTFAEYEAAALRAVQCVDEINGEIYGEARYDERTHTYQVAARQPPPASGQIDLNSPDQVRMAKATDACWKSHWNGINNAWAAQNQPTEQEMFDARQALAACLREAGIEVPDPASQEDFAGLERTESYFPCVKRIEQEFGIPGFGG